MFLFIFESIGTQELILIGIVALIFLGPRKLPEYARKAAKLMHEFRTTTNEFKETWEREVNFEEEAKSLQLDTIENEVEKPVARIEETVSKNNDRELAVPVIKEADSAQMEKMKEMAAINKNADRESRQSEKEPDEASDKGAWL